MGYRFTNWHLMQPLCHCIGMDKRNYRNKSGNSSQAPALFWFCYAHIWADTHPHIRRYGFQISHWYTVFIGMASWHKSYAFIFFAQTASIIWLICRVRLWYTQIHALRSILSELLLWWPSFRSRYRQRHRQLRPIDNRPSHLPTINTELGAICGNITVSSHFHISCNSVVYLWQ